ncbi:putative FMN-dependent luciferase-like monooxygenase, KPN_01858 family [Georgenia satyanarayanai]|uniref:Putative FMN-dependent luciferase-like monooxygenase, KPN_01858 family n=1 Tax=Georgenia satyanarayanai TaxID=860221 RepID=A0A2Y9ACS5_9MICO|nr:putative FMN-dependent luciferase-like monooxygenase [Georgenia satyanarayanai]PYG00074.1 putative FMN-dependent luciferase-like monooxygenase [Georgenia satyanarayanai]SSA40097.1 putative FMN-dependent luciferase-like monooxygenase, KPN_01858 family [Georgenia satyanarayanai]
MSGPRLGFFTRVLDDAPPAERYRLALEQIRTAEAAGFDAVAVAQHHLDGGEGGLPSPLVLLAHVAAVTARVRLTTGVITLALEDPVRVAEDAAVLDHLSGGRVELGLASGGSPGAFAALGLDFADRHAVFTAKLDRLEAALRGEPVACGRALYPPAGTLTDRLWIGTFSEPWAVEAGRRGHGLMLSRTQPRPAGEPDLGLGALQERLVDAYLEHLPAGVEPRISVARTVVVTDDERRATELAESGLRKVAPLVERTTGRPAVGLSTAELVAATDSHVGSPATVLAGLRADPAVARATHLSFQVHSVDPPHPEVLRSVELLAGEVAPALGWRPAALVTA